LSTRDIEKLLKNSPEETSNNQHNTWRKELDDKKYLDIAAAQRLWQESGYFARVKMAKTEEIHKWGLEVMKKGINDIVGDMKNPAVAELPKRRPGQKYMIEKELGDVIEKNATHVYRGVQLAMADEVEPFLVNFEVGKEITMPPCGWSCDPKVASDNSISRIGMTFPTVGVFFMMKSKDDKISGLHMSGLTTENTRNVMGSVAEPTRPNEDDYDTHKGFSDALAKYRLDSHKWHYYGKNKNDSTKQAEWAAMVNFEEEIARPANALAKVAKIRKIVVDKNSAERPDWYHVENGLFVYYVIELEETGKLTDNPELVMEDKRKSSKYLQKHMRGTVNKRRFTSKKKSIKLKSLIKRKK